MRRIGLIGEKAPPRPYFEGCRVYGDRIKSGIMNKQSSALTHREHYKETIRSESERFFIGIYKMLINRIFSRIKVSLLHSILVLQLLHLLA